MNKVIRCSFAGLLSIVVASCTCAPAQSSLTSRPNGAPSISDIIESVQDAIDSFYQKPGALSNLPPLKSVKLSLQTVSDSKASGEADYLLIALKGYNENANTQELDVTLVPEAPNPAGNKYAGGISIADALKKAIEQAQKQLQRSYSSQGRTLDTSEVDVQISFAVTWDGSLGINKWELSPITLTASEEISKKTTQTITVAFGKPSG